MKLRKPKRAAARRTAAEPLILASTQAELDEAAGSGKGVLILGGTPVSPLIIRKKFRVRPIIGDGACVLLRGEGASGRSQPPDVLVTGRGANVLAMGHAYVECRGESMIRLKDKTRARMYKGRLAAGGEAKACLYGRTTAVLWDRARCLLRNDASADCYDRSRAILSHTTLARLHGKKSTAWKKGRNARIIDAERCTA